MPTRLKVLVVTAVGVLAAVIALLIFPRAFPVIGLENRMTQRTALAAADSFFAEHSLADSATRRAVRFGRDQESQTFIDLEAGGPDTLNALVKGRDVALFDWSVRAFEPKSIHEAGVSFAPDGRVIGFSRQLADSESFPAITEDSARSQAHHVMATWLGERLDRWKVSATSYETVKPSERVDRTITFERNDKKVGTAPIRMDVVIAGNLPVEARPYLEIPDAFDRRYTEMRSSNELYSIVSSIGALILFGLGVWTIRRFGHHGLLRWKPAFIVGGVIGLLLTAAALNSLGSAWYYYDTATSPGIIQAVTLLGAVAGGVSMAILVSFTLVAAEAAARVAYPDRVDWWQAWRARGTREVAGQVGGGYAAAMIALAYVATFYLVTRNAFGWWVPSELLDDPNQIATPAPWITGLAASLQAGVWEEALFRALPLSLLSLWVGRRPHRNRWMIGGIVVTSLVFGFAHANYPSWPAYSRGVEIFLDACFWAFLFVRVGLLVTVLAHFLYDLVLFSMFTATGTALEYRLSFAIATFVLLLPALAVLWKLARQRGFVALDPSMTFGAWTRPEPAPALAPIVDAPPSTPMSERMRQLALASFAAAVAMAFVVDGVTVRGPAFTASRDAVVATADSMLASRGANPAEWRRLSTTASDTQSDLRLFLREHDADSLFDELAATYARPAWWTLRYVHTTGSVAERAAEWRVRVFPDGRPFDTRHIVPDSAAGASLPADSIRAVARRAFTAAGFNLARYRETDYDEIARPNRRDALVTWTDTVLKLPAGATAVAYVDVAGDEPLVARRGIRLPESFHRAQRDESTQLLATFGLFMLALFGLMVGGMVYAAKRRPALVVDEVVGGNRKWIWLGVLVLLSYLTAANSVRDLVFSYDTASPWVNFVAMGAISAGVAPIVGFAVLLGFWSLMEMLRRRAGIVAWPATRDGVRDAMVAGLGLGGMFSLMSLSSVAVAGGAIGFAPTTALNELIPGFSGVLGIPGALVALVVTGSLAPLTLLAAARENRTRWLIVLAIVLAMVLVTVPLAESFEERTIVSDPDVLGSFVGLAAFIGVIVGLIKWAPRSALTWFVATLVAVAIGGLQDLGSDVTTGEKAAAAIRAIAAGVAAYALMRAADRKAQA